MYYTYVIKSLKDGRWYTGATNNLRERFKEHNQNLVFSTKSRGPFKIIYYEACQSREDAFVREKFLKSGPRKHYLKNRLKRSLSLTGFTLIEITLVIALIIIIFGFGLTISFDSYRKDNLKAERDTLISVLQKARNESINNLNNTPHGFYFDGTDYILFDGSSYASRDASRDLKIVKNPSITIGGLTEIVFEQLDGNANPIGDITLSDGINPVISININQEGRINW